MIGCPSCGALPGFPGATSRPRAGRRADAVAELEKALVFYRSVGATFVVEPGERVLAEAKSA